MRAYVCFDDTDTLDCGRGTGKLARWFEDELPEGCTMWGVLRQQLLVDPAIPYTSHNSSACAVVDIASREIAEKLIARAAAHIERHAVEGSDPGLCVAVDEDGSLAPLVEFGRLAATSVTTQSAAIEAAKGVHLSGHGGTNDGIIGAAAGVGLTAAGWSGRFIEYGRIRDYPDQVPIAKLQAAGIQILPLDRDGGAPRPTDVLDSEGWLRPRLWGAHPAVPVVFVEDGLWRAVSPRKKRAEPGHGAARG